MLIGCNLIWFQGFFLKMRPFFNLKNLFLHKCKRKMQYLKRCAPCSLLCVLLRGQLASTSSATQVRLFLPCSRIVQSSRDRSKALLVSSPTPLQGGILQDKTIKLFNNHSGVSKVYHTQVVIVYAYSKCMHLSSCLLLQ